VEQRDFFAKSMLPEKTGDPPQETIIKKKKKKQQQ